jgi:hypothetical protein
MGLGCHAVLKVYASHLTQWFIFVMQSNPLSPFLYLGQDDHLYFTKTGD